MSSTPRHSFKTTGIEPLRSCPILGFYIWDTNTEETKWRLSLLLDVATQPNSNVQELIQLAINKGENQRLDTVRIYIEANSGITEEAVIRFKNHYETGMTTTFFMQGYDIMSVSTSGRIHAACGFVSDPSNNIRLPTLDDIISSMEECMPGYRLVGPTHEDGILAWHLIVIGHCLARYLTAPDLHNTLSHLRMNFPSALTPGVIIHND